MIQNLIDAIALILSDNFPDVEDIYTEEVKQDLTTPCFSIFSMPMSDARQLGKRWKTTYTMCVQYIPSENEPKKQCAAVEEKLFKLLEYLTVDGAKIMCRNAHSENADEVLNWFGDYEIFTLEEPVCDVDIMSEEKINIAPKG